MFLGTNPGQNFTVKIFLQSSDLIAFTTNIHLTVMNCSHIMYTCIQYFITLSTLVYYTGRHYSSIDDSKRSHTARQFDTGRRCTLSGSNPPLTVVMAPHPEIPTIVTTTEVAQGSQESIHSAAALPENDKHFVISSSPSSMSMLSIPSISELQPENNQTSQKEQLKSTITPLLQHSYRSHSSNIVHSKSEGILHTGSSISLHQRQPINHRLSEPTSSSCSRLEIPPPGHSPQMHTSPKAGPSYSDMSHENIMINHNTSLPNSSCATVCSHPLSRSMSLDYHHQPHKCGHGYQPIYRSPSPLIYSHARGSHNNCSPSAYAIAPEAPQNGHSETDMPHSTIVCKCVRSQCTHCGLFRDVPMPHHLPTMVYVPVVCPTPPGQMLSMSSSPGTQRNQRHPRARRECGVKSCTTQLSSATALQREQLIGNQNPAESDSESDCWSSTNDDQKPNHATICAKNENKPAKSMRPLKSSKKKEVPRQRPHLSTSDASTCAKHNLHTSAETLPVQTSPSIPTSGAKRKWRHVFFPAKPKTMHPEPNQVIWPIKRDKLYKYIYKHTSKLKTCKEKLELVPDRDDCGPLPKFILQLHPYGSEEDSNRCITAKVTIDFPKKCRLFSKTKTEFQVCAQEDNSSTGKEIGHK